LSRASVENGTDRQNQTMAQGNSLDAASMVDMAAANVHCCFALIWQRPARVTDDLCDIFCKQMKRTLHSARSPEKYLADNQEKTDEILRRFATLVPLVHSRRTSN
jgi:hypothetical protein